MELVEVQALLGNCTMLKRLKTFGFLAGPEPVLVRLYSRLAGLLELETLSERESRQTAGQTSPGLLMMSDLSTLGVRVFITCRKCSYCCSHLSPVYCEPINHSVVFTADLSSLTVITDHLD